MPLVDCPHMNARCPHYRNECDDAESKDCFYIKTSTTVAMSRLFQLRAMSRTDFNRGDQDSSGARTEIESLEAFLSGKRRPVR